MGFSPMNYYHRIVKKTLIPLPSYGFDPTEVAVPWSILTQQRFPIYFATPQGKKAAADELMLTGNKLGIWKKILRAREDAVIAYKEMEKSDEFSNPLTYEAAKEHNFDALLLPGGHDKGVKEYIESKHLQSLVVNFFRANKPVAAICHGVLLAARSIDDVTGKSVLYDYETTSLLKSQELNAWRLTRMWLKDYYRTYPEITVQNEVTSVLSNKKRFIKGPTPLHRDDLQNLKKGFTVRDRNYLSARWPGDVYNFSLEFINMLS